MRIAFTNTKSQAPHHCCDFGHKTHRSNLIEEGPPRGSSRTPWLHFIMSTPPLYFCWLIMACYFIQFYFFVRTKPLWFRGRKNLLNQTGQQKTSAKRNLIFESWNFWENTILVKHISCVSKWTWVNPKTHRPLRKCFRIFWLIRADDPAQLRFLRPGPNLEHIHCRRHSATIQGQNGLVKHRYLRLTWGSLDSISSFPSMNRWQEEMDGPIFMNYYNKLQQTHDLNNS